MELIDDVEEVSDWLDTSECTRWTRFCADEVTGVRGDCGGVARSGLSKKSTTLESESAVVITWDACDPGSVVVLFVVPLISCSSSRAVIYSMLLVRECVCGVELKQKLFCMVVAQIQNHFIQK